MNESLSHWGEPVSAANGVKHTKIYSKATNERKRSGQRSGVGLTPM